MVQLLRKSLPRDIQLEEINKLKHHYRNKVTDRELYLAILKKREPYMTDKALKQMYHQYSTQQNESLMNVISKYIPKGTNLYGRNLSKTRARLAVAVNSVGFLSYYTNVYMRMGIVMNSSTIKYLRRLDRISRYVRDYNNQMLTKKRRCDRTNGNLRKLREEEIEARLSN